MRRGQGWCSEHRSRFQFHLLPFRRKLYGASFTIGCRAAHSRIHAFANNDFAVVTRSAVFTPTIFSALLSGQIADGVVYGFAAVHLIVPLRIRLTECVCACVGLLRIHRSCEEQKCEEYRYNEKGPQGGLHVYIITARRLIEPPRCGILFPTQIARPVVPSRTSRNACARRNDIQ